MKQSTILYISFFLFIQVGFAQNKILDSFEIKSEEIPEGYTFSKKLFCQSIQAKTFYNSPDLYSFMIGETLEKRFQTIKYKGEKGSILYFEFNQDATNGESFIKNLLWGGKKPSKRHPEEIVTKGKVMIVLSFPYKSDLREKMIELIKKK